MKLALRKLFLLLTIPMFSLGAAARQDDAVTFSTLAKTELTIEGLTHDASGYLYAPGRRTAGDLQNCPIYRIAPTGAVAVVGFVTPNGAANCSPSGLAFGPDGLLYVTETSRIFRLAPDPVLPPIGTVFTTAPVPGTNGVAFDRDGNLWTGDGTQGQGRVWKIDAAGNPTLMFLVQPMANSLGIGRSNQTLQPPAPANPQPLVANGLQFTSSGDLLIADTARGAIWQVALARDGTVLAPMGCDSTFPANTLCLDNILVAHPLLDGADGFVLDVAGNLWVSANERNSMVFVSAQGEVREVFRNPVAATGRRNQGPLESPTSPTLVGPQLCTANSDGNRRDNSPNNVGEVSPTVAPRGKVSCMDQRATVRGAELPIR